MHRRPRADRVRAVLKVSAADPIQRSAVGKVLSERRNSYELLRSLRNDPNHLA